jgi:hypothetical protein
MPIPIVSKGRAAPGANPSQRGRELGRTGASRDQRPQRFVSCGTLRCARPWRASVRRVAPRHGRQAPSEIRHVRCSFPGPRQPGHFTPQPAVEIEDRRVQRLSRDRDPQVEYVAAGAAAEAVPHAPIQVGRERKGDAALFGLSLKLEDCRRLLLVVSVAAALPARRQTRWRCPRLFRRAAGRRGGWWRGCRGPSLRRYAGCRWASIAAKPARSSPLERLCCVICPERWRSRRARSLRQRTWRVREARPAWRCGRRRPARRSGAGTNVPVFMLARGPATGLQLMTHGYGRAARIPIG